MVKLLQILACTSVISGDLARRVAGPARPWRRGLLGYGGSLPGDNCSIDSASDPAQAKARQAAKLALRPRLPRRAGALHPGLVHAPGWTVTARVPQAARGHRDAGVMLPARAGHRDHAPAAAPVRRRRGDPVQ